MFSPVSSGAENDSGPTDRQKLKDDLRVLEEKMRPFTEGYIRRTHVEDIINVAIIRDKNNIMLPIRIEEQPEDLNDRKSLSIPRYGKPQAGPMD